MVKRNQTVEDTSPLIIYSPPDQWIDGNNGDPDLPLYSAGTFRLTTTRGAKASFSFNGTGVWIYGAKRSNHGPYMGTIDGTDSPQQDGFSATDMIQTLLYSATNLAMGPHTVSITDEQVNAAAPYMDVDFIVWETEISDSATQPTYQLDDTDPSFTYQPAGEWSTNQCVSIGSYLDTTCHITSSSTASVQLTFNGDSVAIYGGVGPRYGPYTVTMDNQPAASFTANSTSHHTQQILYFASNLGPGNHSVTMSNDPNTVGNILDIDFVQIMGGGLPASAPSTGGSGSGTSGQNNGGGGGGGTHKKSNVGAIAGGIIAAVVVLTLALVLAFFLWRRRRQTRGTKSSPVDLDDEPNMRVVMEPTPYKPEENTTQTEFNPYFHGQRPITNYTTQYTISDVPNTPTQGNSSPQQRDSPFRHQNHASITNLTTFSGEGTASGSGSGAGPSGMPPLSAVGAGKGESYAGATIRNDPGAFTPMVDPPPSYS